MNKANQHYHGKGDRWLSLAVVTENPRCGWVVVMKPDGIWDVFGTCFEEHEHSDAIMEALARLR